MLGRCVINSDRGIPRTYTLVNGRELRVEGYSNGVKVDKKNGEVTSFKLEGSPSISIGDTLNLRFGTFKVGYIIRLEDKDGVKKFALFPQPKSRSCYFVLPMLGDYKDVYHWDKYFVNAFLDVEQEKYSKSDTLYLLYRWSSDLLFKEFEMVITKHPNYLGSYDPDGQHVMLMFSIPDEYYNDYLKFLRGKYFDMSEEYKLQIQAFHEASEDSRLVGILHRYRSIKKQLELEIGETIPEGLDYESKPTLEEETYLNKYRITKEKNLKPEEYEHSNES